MRTIRKSHVVGLIAIFIIVFGLFYSKRAHADGYFGFEPGLGMGSGTALPLNSGLELGGTLGYQLLPSFGVALTYQHDSLGITNTNISENISQIMAEANVFSFLMLSGGVHIGDVITNVFGTSSADLGFGLHLGFDIHLADNMSAGLAAYWTYVTESNDKHSLINLVVPLKVWF